MKTETSRGKMGKRKIVFMTGTRADFGKMKSLIKVTADSGMFDVHLFVTGMHLIKKYGYTIDEIKKCRFRNIHALSNHTAEHSMDKTLAKTISGFSNYISSLQPDLIVVHGDRIETLAGAMVGALNNILVAHVEGGEVSGTIDELIRHAVTKMSHIHFAGNKNAANRLIQLGELKQSIYTIGSPDVDTMISKLPEIRKVLAHYEVPFNNYGLVLFHPVTSELDQIDLQANELVNALLASDQNYIVIYPNNDNGSKRILSAYKKLKGKQNIRVYPSIRFEYFLTLMKHARFMIGNSSAGIYEAPYFGVPTINIGSRQTNRSKNRNIINTSHSKKDLLSAIHKALNLTLSKQHVYGTGNSAGLFLETLLSQKFWKTNHQKHFNDMPKS
jgi:UDP-N-acetylglucosamine 2-epimerase (hydrolysing)